MEMSVPITIATFYHLHSPTNSALLSTSLCHYPTKTISIKMLKEHSLAQYKVGLQPPKASLPATRAPLQGFSGVCARLPSPLSSLWGTVVSSPPFHRISLTKINHFEYLPPTITPKVGQQIKRVFRQKKTCRCSTSSD